MLLNPLKILRRAFLIGRAQFEPFGQNWFVSLLSFWSHVVTRIVGTSVCLTDAGSLPCFEASVFLYLVNTE
jgi:hypothetical protein